MVSLALVSGKNSSFFGQLWPWQPPCKRSKSSLFSSYERRRTGTGGQNVASQVPLPTVVKNYLGFVRQQSDGLSADTWRAVQQESQFTILHKLFEKVFCTPATSAPVERVFSHSGLFMRPHRARMGDRMLADLVFSKCNKHIWLTITALKGCLWCNINVLFFCCITVLVWPSQLFVIVPFSEIWNSAKILKFCHICKL